MKRPTMLVKAILRQAEVDLDLSVERDVRTIERRCKHEGLSFLTLTLPVLSDALESGLESGLFSCPSSFARHGSLPRFLGGFFKRVFTLDGRLRDDACPEAVGFIRQICRFFKKLKKECSEAVNNLAIQHFIDVEGELRHATSQVMRKDDILDKIAGIIWSQVFPEIDYVGLVCHHGPGYTADKLSTNGRRRIRKWNQRSEYRFPSDLHCYPNYGYASDFSGIGETSPSAVEISYLDLKDELPVRVVFVPKTQKAPRVIAMEPSHMQYIQQSVKDLMYAALESHALTKNSIRFTRQEPNQILAYRGSIDRRTSTLDLKDASDRVHLHLVQRIFKTSGLLEYLEDARSLHATLPNGRNIVLSKYASMGSALCFPVEASVFYTLIQAAMHQLDGTRPSSRSIRRYSRMIAVYGDDIVVPVEYTDVVVRYLESYALKVNVSKSFSKGNFRESCGEDFFKGVPVNPVYARQVPHDNARDWEPKAVMAWAATADFFYERGQWIVAEAIRTMVQSVVRRPIPLSKFKGSGLVFKSLFQTTDLFYNKDLQGFKQKRTQYQPSKKKDNIDGDAIACLNHWGQSNHRYDRNDVFPEDPNKFRRRYYSGSERFGPRGPNESLGLEEVVGKSVRHDECRMVSTDGEVPQGITSECICSICRPQSVTESLCAFLFRLGGYNVVICLLCSLEPLLEDRASAGSCPVDDVERDLLGFLVGRTEGIDFESSTNRGVFKSKRRWVSIAS